MSTLQSNHLNFNKNISVSNNGGNISTDGGLIIVQEFLAHLNLTTQIEETIQFKDSRLHCRHTRASTMSQIILQKISGYFNDSDANILRHDPLFQQLLGKEVGASQSTISRFYNDLSADNLTDMAQLNQLLLDYGDKQTQPKERIIDLDTTHCDTFGNQEDADYNPHYGVTGYQPLLAFDGLTGACLAAELRSGSTYSSKKIGDFLTPLLTHHRQLIKGEKLLVRGDSGFASPEVYDAVEENLAHFVVKLKNNSRLYDLAEHRVKYTDRTPKTGVEIQYYECYYQAYSWRKARRVVLKCTRTPGELLFSYQFIVTNLSAVHYPAKLVFKLYNKRGTMENYIKEAKTGFNLDKTTSSSFLKNAVHMMLGILAYNLVYLLKQLAFPPTKKNMTIAKIRRELIKIGVKVTSSGRRIHLKLTSTNVHDDFFWTVLTNVHQLAV